MAAFPTSPVTGNVYVLLRKPTRTTVLVTGALSFSAVDVDNYDNGTHSLLLGAEHFGNPHYVPVVTGGGQSVYQVNGSVTTVAGNYVSSDPQTLENKIATTDIDFVQDTTPAPTMRKETFFCWWSGASASGNLLAVFRARDVVGFGPALPVSI
jgi:hypothetical protein